MRQWEEIQEMPWGMRSRSCLSSSAISSLIKLQSRLKICLVVVPEGGELTDGEIEKAVGFQERWFEHQIVLKNI